MRAAFTFTKPAGLKMPNGNVLHSGEDHKAMLTVRTVAQQQLVRDIIALRQPLDLTVAPLLRDLARASFVVDTLRERVFDKISCLSRAGITGLKAPELAAYKASIMTAYRDVSPVELNRLIQAAIDDGSGDSLPLLDCLRMLNFSRPKDERGADNARLLALARVPEYDESQPLLDEVKIINNQALLLWSQFQNFTSSVSLMKISTGLGKHPTVIMADDPYAAL